MRDWTGAFIGASSAARLALLDEAGDVPDAQESEHLAADLDAKHVLEFHGHLDYLKGVAAKAEGVVVGADADNLYDPLEDLDDPGFHRVGALRRSLLRFVTREFRQLLPVDLVVREHRHFAEKMGGGWHHMLGQARGEALPEFLRRRRAARY